jgi:hypothetical protein
MTALDIALGYIDRGWNPVAYAVKEKGPRTKDWEKLTVSDTNVHACFNGQDQNIGLMMGETSHGLTDVDLDAPEAIRVAPYFLPSTPAMFGRASKRYAHHLYYTNLAKQLDRAVEVFDDPILAEEAKKTKGGKPRIVELRTGGGGKGAQTMAPGSVHPNGEPISWEPDGKGDPATVDGSDLLRRVNELAAAALIARYWPAARHNTALALGGFLARCGMPEERIKVFVEAIAVAAGVERRDTVRTAIDAAQEYAANRKAYGLTQVREVFGAPVANKCADWLGYRHDRTDDGQAQTNAAAQPAEPTELFDPWARYIVPAFPIETLPPIVRHFVTVQSELIGCDRSALAMAALGAISGAIDHRSALKMLRNGNWWVSPRLWVLLVGDPSVKKTPIIDAATAELDELQSGAFRKYANDKAEYVAAGGDAEQYKAPRPRLTVYDATVEKLGMILANQDRGMLVKRDEIAGWVGAMEKYNSGRGAMTDRAFWLKAFDGGPYSVDRVSRPDLQIKNLSASIIGGIQPTRLAEIHGLTSDGLLQRFLPVLVSASAFPRDVSSTIYADRYAGLLRSLVELPVQKLFLADDAVTPMEELRRHLFDLEHNAGGIADAFQAFVGKLAGMAGSLALIMTLTGEEPADRVPAAVVDDVAKLVKDFILPHAFEFYSASTGGAERLRTLASWILTSGKTRILQSDLTTKVWDFRGKTVWEVNQGVSPLIAGGWLTPEQQGPVAKAWIVNPQVHAQFANRAADEERRKTIIAKAMNSPRQNTTAANANPEDPDTRARREPRSKRE